MTNSEAAAQPFCFPVGDNAKHYPRLERDQRVDVAIVGGGIVGLTAAHLLSVDDLTLPFPVTGALRFRPPVRILVTGASGLIGSAVCAQAIAEGNQVVATIRPGAATRPSGIERAVEIDIAEATREADWTVHLDGVDAVVNCAGVFAAALQTPLPPRQYSLFRLWFVFGFPAFAAVLAIFWLMITKPAIQF